jgi:aryl sulfotransferase
MEQPVDGPRKMRDFQNHHFDSTIRHDLKFRDDDGVIATYAESGTTWVQQIVAQLGDDCVRWLDSGELCP